MQIALSITAASGNRWSVSTKQDTGLHERSFWSAVEVNISCNHRRNGQQCWQDNCVQSLLLFWEVLTTFTFFFVGFFHLAFQLLHTESRMQTNLSQCALGHTGNIFEINLKQPFITQHLTNRWRKSIMSHMLTILNLPFYNEPKSGYRCSSMTLISHPHKMMILLSASKDAYVS